MAKMKKTDQKYPGLTLAQEMSLAGLEIDVQKMLIEKWTAANIKAEAVRKTNREVFSIVTNEKGTVIVRGLGQKFPLGLNPNTARQLIAHFDEFRAFVNALPVDKA